MDNPDYDNPRLWQPCFCRVCGASTHTNSEAQGTLAMCGAHATRANLWKNSIDRQKQETTVGGALDIVLK